LPVDAPRSNLEPELERPCFSATDTTRVLERVSSGFRVVVLDPHLAEAELGGEAGSARHEGV